MPVTPNLPDKVSLWSYGWPELTHYKERAVAHRNPPASASPVLELKSAAMSTPAPLSALTTCYSTPYSSAEGPTFFTTAAPHSGPPSQLIYLGRSGSSLNHQFKYLLLCRCQQFKCIPISPLAPSLPLYSSPLICCSVSVSSFLS